MGPNPWMVFQLLAKTIKQWGGHIEAPDVKLETNLLLLPPTGWFLIISIISVQHDVVQSGVLTALFTTF